MLAIDVTPYINSLYPLIKIEDSILETVTKRMASLIIDFRKLEFPFALKVGVSAFSLMYDLPFKSAKLLVRSVKFSWIL